MLTAEEASAITKDAMAIHIASKTKTIDEIIGYVEAGIRSAAAKGRTQAEFQGLSWLNDGIIASYIIAMLKKQGYTACSYDPHFCYLCIKWENPIDSLWRTEQ